MSSGPPPAANSSSFCHAASPPQFADLDLDLGQRASAHLSLQFCAAAAGFVVAFRNFLKNKNWPRLMVRIQLPLLIKFPRASARILCGRRFHALTWVTG